MSHDFELADLTNNSDVAAKSGTKLLQTGKIIAGVTGGVALGLTVVCIPFLSPAFRKFCLPYIPATNDQVKNVLTALKGRRGTVLDLGSGDGRIVFESAKKGLVSHGVELNPWLVLYSKFDALRKGLRERTQFFRGDLWKFNVSNYDNIVIFGVEQMMADLKNKLEAECKKDCHIVACRFPLPDKQPITTIGSGIDAVWVYQTGRPQSKIAR